KANVVRRRQICLDAARGQGLSASGRAETSRAATVVGNLLTWRPDHDDRTAIVGKQKKRRQVQRATVGRGEGPLRPERRAARIAVPVARLARGAGRGLAGVRGGHHRQPGAGWRPGGGPGEPCRLALVAPAARGPVGARRDRRGAGAGRGGPWSDRRRPLPRRTGGARQRQAGTDAGGPGRATGAFSLNTGAGETPESPSRRKR